MTADAKFTFKELVIVLLNVWKEFCEWEDVIVSAVEFDADTDLLDIGLCSRLRTDIFIPQGLPSILKTQHNAFSLHS